MQIHRSRDSRGTLERRTSGVGSAGFTFDRLEGESNDWVELTDSTYGRKARQIFLGTLTATLKSRVSLRTPGQCFYYSKRIMAK